jgi:hypothetical protein
MISAVAEPLVQDALSGQKDFLLNSITIPAHFKWWAKMGYSARGAIYLVIGGLAVMTATGAGGEITDTRGAILTVLQQPFGYALLILLIIGLCGYSVWRLIQSIQDTDGHGTSLKGLSIRLALFGSSITHGLLALWAISVLLGRSDAPTDTAGFLGSTSGQIIFGIAGIICVIAGAAHIYKGWKAGYERYMYLPPHTQVWARPVCRFGLIARGAVWCIVGWFCMDSALKAQQAEVKGIDEALSILQQSDHGPWLLLVVASGLFAFGVYSCLEAIFRRINTNPQPDTHQAGRTL